MSHHLDSRSRSTQFKAFSTHHEQLYTTIEPVVEESPKVVVTRRWRGAIFKARVHILPTAVAVALAVVNWRTYIRGPEVTKYMEFGLQVASKAYVSPLPSRRAPG